MQLTDFHYDLPKELIASYPLKQRSKSRLLCLNRNTGETSEQVFSDLTSLISEGDLVVCNNTQVIAARLLGQKQTGGHVEMLIERILDNHRVLAHIRASKSPKAGSLLIFRENIYFEVLSRQENLFELSCHDARSVLEIIEDVGEIPLPPYLQRSPEEDDKTRYQTIYAKHKGSVAAPTAGLHFDSELWAALHKKGVQINFVTLHIGAGTFAPVRVADITQHKMHSEFLHVSEALCEQINATKKKGGRIIAVGTTTARSLETAAFSGKIKPFSGETNIFIYPGFKFNCVDALITNFHLPSSTLLMLTSAFGGYDSVMAAYRRAVQEKFRFFSYGDAMFIF